MPTEYDQGGTDRQSKWMKPREGVGHSDLDRNPADQHNAGDRRQRIVPTVTDPGYDRVTASMRTRRTVIHTTH
jgi:hypothetical protein